MKVLIVHPSNGFYGGAEEVIIQLCKYLEAKNHSVRLITMHNPKELETWVALPKPRNWLEFRAQVQSCLGFYDIVNVHNFPATLTTFPKKVPTVYMCNEPAELFTKLWKKPIETFNRWWVRKSGMKVVVADQVNADRFKSIYKVEPTIIPYGIDYKFWSQGVRQSRQDNKVKILQVGTVTPYKNQLESIRALEHLVDRGIDASLTLAGSLPDEYYYKKVLKPFIDDYGLQEYTEVLGQQTHEELRYLLYTHDVLLHPVKGQGGWLVPFEAMCTGLPVVTIPLFSASSLIEDNNLGIVTRAIEQVIVNKGYEKLDTKKIKDWVRGNLTWEKFGESMVKVFREKGVIRSEEDLL